MDLTPALVHDTVRRLTGPGAPFEIVDQVVGGAKYQVFAHAAPTLPAVLAMGRKHGDADFIIFEGQRWSFAEFFRTADALAAALQHDYGVRPGDRVAIAMRNCPDWLLAFTAATSIGAVVVPINSWGSAAELQYTLRDSGAVVLAGDLPRALLATDVLTHNVIPILLSEIDGRRCELPPDIAGHVKVIRDIAALHRGSNYTAAQPAPEDPAMLMYTSGSTGQAKGVIYRHATVGQSLMHMMLVGFLAIEFGGPVGLRGGAQTEATLVTVPLFHATGLFSGFLMPCITGQKVALMRKWDAEAAMRVIGEEKITMLSTVPAILKDLLTHPAFDDCDLSSITRVAAAGAATPADLPDLLRDKLGILTRSAGYGMTETASVGATMSGPVFDLKPLSCGIPSPIIDIRAADSSGHPLSAGQDGEIQMRGVTVTPGYWQQDALTAEAFTEDGWLRTGDIGHLDADGFVHVTGRIKELVIRGGENIAPAEIENVAYRHQAVKEVAVFGVPDDAMGEELALVFHVRAGASVTEAQLRMHLREGLPAFKVPKYIIESPDPLPRNASEKIHRLELRNGFVPN